MKEIFEQGEFRAYSEIRLDEAKSPVIRHSIFGISKPTVFISHKHDDLYDLKGVIGLLQNNYDVLAYIDSRDSTMPAVTSAKTAINIKNRIIECDKFILLATNSAIESKWCNWELGFGDAQKYEKHIAIFPMKPAGRTDAAYRGSEYMDIYPHIVHSFGFEYYGDSYISSPGYYVISHRNNKRVIPLKDWLYSK